MLSAFAFIALGLVAFSTLNIEAYPARRRRSSRSSRNGPADRRRVERYVTIPIEIAVASTPGLKYIRSTPSSRSASAAAVRYERNCCAPAGHQSLKDVTLPTGVQPVISPAGGISEIVLSAQGSTRDGPDRAQDAAGLGGRASSASCPGSPTSVLGGKTKEFQAEVDLNKMMAYGMTLPQVLNAITVGNSNVGGRTIAIGEQSVNVRGIGGWARSTTSATWCSRK
jgi:cobalt-zinc-cadmium resistance protein CzcA